MRRDSGEQEQQWTWFRGVVEGDNNTAAAARETSKEQQPSVHQRGLVSHRGSRAQRQGKGKGKGKSTAQDSSGIL
jgi:hypothetical protein